MAISDIYTVSSGTSGTITQGTSAPVLLLVGSTAMRLWIVGIEVHVVSVGSTVPTSVQFQLARPNNAAAGSTAANVNPNDINAPSLGVAGWNAYTTFSTAPTLATPPALLWEKFLPGAAGSAWVYDPPTGYEWSVPLHSGSSGLAVVWVTVNGSSGATATVDADLYISQ